MGQPVFLKPVWGKSKHVVLKPGSDRKHSTGSLKATQPDIPRYSKRRSKREKIKRNNYLFRFRCGKERSLVYIDSLSGPAFPGNQFNPLEQVFMLGECGGRGVGQEKEDVEEEKKGGGVWSG